MDKNIINSDNWTFCHYATNNLKAVITLGGSPELIADDQFDFYITVLNADNIEQFQKKFKNLKSACLEINNKYGKIWDFKDATVKEGKEGGCSTCVAH